MMKVDVYAVIDGDLVHILPLSLDAVGYLHTLNGTVCKPGDLVTVDFEDWVEYTSLTINLFFVIDRIDPVREEPAKAIS